MNSTWYIIMGLQLIILTLSFLIWRNSIKKKPKQEPADLSDRAYMASLIPELMVLDSPPRLHQYKGFVIKTEKKKQKWHHEIWDNAMTKKLMVGNSLATDKRSYEELIKDIENDIDESPEKYI